MKNLTKNFWVIAVLVLIAGASARSAFATCGQVADTLDPRPVDGAPAVPPPPPPGTPSTATTGQ